MGSSPSKPNLSQNKLAIAREEKLKNLIEKWYEAAIQDKAALPSTDDPNLLFYTTKTDYYYTCDISFVGGANAINPPWGLHRPIYIPYRIKDRSKISVNSDAVDCTIRSSLMNTTKHDTGEGYATCVIQSFDGAFDGKECLYKAIVVAVSFDFSSSEYKTDRDVAAFGYRIYFFRADSPFRDQEVSEVIHGESLAYQIPPDINIVGRRYMTTEELDQYNP